MQQLSAESPSPLLHPLSHFQNYNVEELHLVNKKYKRSDFIAKFIKMNKSEFHSLNLEKVQFEEDIRDLAVFLKEADTKI